MRLKQYCKLSPWKKSLELDGLAARFYQAFTDEPTSISLKQPALPWYPNHIRLPQWARCEAVEVMFELQWTHPSTDDDRSMSCLSKTAVRTQGSWTNREVMCFRKLDHRDKITKMIGAWKNPRLALATQHGTIGFDIFPVWLWLWFGAIFPCYVFFSLLKCKYFLCHCFIRSI